VSSKPHLISTEQLQSSSVKLQLSCYSNSQSQIQQVKMVQDDLAFKSGDT